MTSPPLPPSPPSGPPFGTNFSRRKLTHPRPPLPACAKTLIRSTNIAPSRCHQQERMSSPSEARNCHSKLRSHAGRLKYPAGFNSTLQRFVKRFRLFRDGEPAEFFFDAFSPGLPKFFAQLRIGHQLINAPSKLTRKFFGIRRL